MSKPIHHFNPFLLAETPEIRYARVIRNLMKRPQGPRRKGKPRLPEFKCLQSKD